jgi:hypothetical protein
MYIVAGLFLFFIFAIVAIFVVGAGTHKTND